MSGLSQLLQTGLTGLSAAAAGLQTVADNTANVNTPGYDVRSVVQTEPPGADAVAGSGANAVMIQRGFDQFLYQQGVRAASVNQAAQVVQTSAQNLVALFPVASGGAGGLGAAFDSFFAAANEVAQDPTSAANRQSFLGQAQSLAAEFRSVAGQIAVQLGAIDGQTLAAVQQTDNLARQIAQLNRAIATQSNVSGSPPNGLLDQRDQLVQQLGEQLGVSVVPGAGGAVNVYSSGGAALVNGATAYQLAIGPSQYGDGAVTISAGPDGRDITASLSDGRIGGLLAARGQLVRAQNAVGVLAAAIGAAVNKQQSFGLDLNGNLGQPLFSFAGPAVYASRSNTGTGALTAAITDPNNLIPDDVIITKTAAGFEAADPVSGQVTALGNGPTLSLNGVTITVSGAVQAGDSFKLEPTAGAALSLATATSDPAAIAAGSPYVVTPGANGGNIQATAGNPVATAALPAGAAVVPASQFGQPITVQFTSSNSFKLLSSGNAVIASGTLSPVSGGEIAIAYPASGPPGAYATVNLSPGSAAVGDSFMLSPGGVGSNGNIAALATLANQNLVAGQTLDSYYSAFVTGIGSEGQSAAAAAQATQAVVTQVQNSQQSVSGVNLDQQAAELVGYQQAYQAAAKVIAAAQTLFQSLLAAVQA